MDSIRGDLDHYKSIASSILNEETFTQFAIHIAIRRVLPEYKKDVLSENFLLYAFKSTSEEGTGKFSLRELARMYPSYKQAQQTQEAQQVEVIAA